MNAVNRDWRTALLSPKQQALLGFIEKLTLRPGEVTSSDMEPLRAAGITDQGIEDAIAICACFSTITRIADTLRFDVPGSSSFDKGAVMLLKRGYIL